MLRAEQLYLVEVDADHWKTCVHQPLSTPPGKGGAMMLFAASPQEHLAMAKHLTAETKVEEFVAVRGVVVKWQRLRRQNHWLDELYNACAAAYLSGARLVGDEPAPEPTQRPAEPPDGAPPQPDDPFWIDLDRYRETFERLMARD